MKTNLEPGDLKRIVDAHRAKDVAVAAANVSLARAKLCEAIAAEVHLDIVTTYELRDGDKYDESGLITRAPVIP